MTQADTSLTTPSDRTGLLIGNLHPLTRWLAIVVLLHLAATLIVSTGTLMHPSPAWAAYPPIEHIAAEAKSVALSLSLFTGPAVIEILLRILARLSTNGR
jgi:hypothetical protein